MAKLRGTDLLAPTGLRPSKCLVSVREAMPLRQERWATFRAQAIEIKREFGDDPFGGSYRLTIRGLPPVFFEHMQKVVGAITWNHVRVDVALHDMNAIAYTASIVGLSVMAPGNLSRGNGTAEFVSGQFVKYDDLATVIGSHLFEDYTDTFTLIDAPHEQTAAPNLEQMSAVFVDGIYVKAPKERTAPPAPTPPAPPPPPEPPRAAAERGPRDIDL